MEQSDKLTLTQKLHKHKIVCHIILEVFGLVLVKQKLFKLQLQFSSCLSRAFSGNKVVTDVTANDGTWTFLCAVWSSGEGYWAVFQDAILADEGKGLSKGETIMGTTFLHYYSTQKTIYTKEITN